MANLAELAISSTVRETRRSRQSRFGFNYFFINAAKSIVSPQVVDLPLLQLLCAR